VPLFSRFDTLLKGNSSIHFEFSRKHVSPPPFPLKMNSDRLSLFVVMMVRGRSEALSIGSMVDSLFPQVVVVFLSLHFEQIPPFLPDPARPGSSPIFSPLASLVRCTDAFWTERVRTPASPLPLFPNGPPLYPPLPRCDFLFLTGQQDMTATVSPFLSPLIADGLSFGFISPRFPVRGDARSLRCFSSIIRLFPSSITVFLPLRACFSETPCRRLRELRCSPTRLRSSFPPSPRRRWSGIFPFSAQ